MKPKEREVLEHYFLLRLVLMTNKCGVERPFRMTKKDLTTNVVRLVMGFSFLCASLVANAEAGKGVYRFLNFPYDAKLTGLGGENVSLQASDVNMAYVNPALLSQDVHNKVSATFVNYLDDAKAGALSYSYAMDTFSYFGASFVYMGFGKFDGYDELGNPTSEFKAGDFCLNLSYARYLGHGMKLGLSMKPIYSHIEDYASFGLGFDVGFNYYNPEKKFSVGIAARNFGVQCKKYYDSDRREEMPLNVQLGFTQGFQHAPLRISVTYDRLNDWNLDYYRDLELKQVIGEEPKSNDIKGVDMFFRHLIFGVEINIGKVFYVEAAYNHRRKREFELTDARSINGFSFGAGVKVFAFSLDAAFSQYAPAANNFTLTLSADIEKFKKK